MRHTAFRKGSAYLERYCMLITFAVYLEAQKTRNQVSLLHAAATFNLLPHPSYATAFHSSKKAQLVELSAPILSRMQVFG